MYDAYSDPLCRLCLANDGDMVYVFDPKGYNGYRVWEIIWELLQLEVSKEDGLPGTICHECLKKVTEFKNFKTVCIRAKISILTHIASRGIVDGDCTPLKPSVPSKPVPKIENAVVPLPPLVKKCDGGSSEDLELLEVIGECKANGNARKTSRLGKRKKKAMGSLRSLRFSSKLPSGGVTKSEPELVEIIEEDIEDEVLLDGAKESSSKNKDGDSPVDSSGTSQAGKDDGPSLNKKSRTEEKHSTANKTVDDSDSRKPTKEDHASRTSHLRSGKVKGRDKDGQSAKGPSTVNHAQKDDDHNVSKTSRKESTQSSVGKPAEESDKHKEGHAGRTSGLHREKTKGREKKDSHSSVDSSGTSQAGKDGGTSSNRKSRTEDSGSSAGKREDSGTRKASKDLDHTTKTSILPKEKGKGREKKGLQVSEESSRGSKSKEGASPKTSAGHDKKQDREQKAVTKEVVQEKSVVEETDKKLPKGHEEGSKKRRCKETSVERPSKLSKKDVPSPVNNARESDASASGSSKGAYVGKGVDASAAKKVSDAAKASTNASAAETVDPLRSNSASLTIPVNRGDSRSNASGAVVEEDPNVVLKNGGRSQKNKTSGKKSSLKKKAAHVDREESEAERSNVPGTVNFIEVPVTKDVIDIDAEVNVDASADPLATIKTEPVEEQPLPTPSVNGQKLRPKGPIYDSVYSNLGPVKEEIVEDPKSSGPAVRGGLSLPPVAALGCPKVKEEPVAVEEIAMDFEEQKYSETLLMGGALPGCPGLPPAAESSLQSCDPLGTGGEGQELNFIAIPSQNPADGDQPFVEVNEDPFADAEENNTARKEPASTPAPGAEVLLKGSGHVVAPTVPGNSLLPPQNAIVHPLPLGLIPSIVNSHVPVALTENQSIAPGGNLCVENFQSDGISGILPLSAVPRDISLPVQEGIQGFAAVASQNVSLASVPLVVNSVNSPSVRQVEFGGQCSDVGVGIGSGKSADLVSGRATARNPVDSSLGCEKLGSNPDGLAQPAQISAPPRDGSSPGSDADTASVPGDLLEEMAEEEWQSAGESDDGWERTKASEVDLGGKIVKVVLERLDDAVVAYYMKGRKESHAESLEDTDDEVREGSMGTETMPFVLSSDEEAGPSRGTAPVTSVSEIQAGQCSGKAVEVSVNEPVASGSSKGLGIEKKTQRKQSKPMGSSGSNSDSDEWTPSNFWGSDWEGDSNSEEEFEPTLFSRKRPNILSKTRTKVPHSKAGHRGPKLEPRPFLGASLPGNAVLSSNNVIVSVGKQFVDVGTLITRLQRSVSGGYVVVNPGCGQSQTESQVPEKGGVESRGDGSTVQNDGGSSQNAALSINTLLAPVSEKDVKKVCFSKPRSAWLARVSNDLDQSPVDSLPQQSRAEGMVNNVHCCDLDQTTGDKSVKPSGNVLERAPVKKLSIVGDSGRDPAVIKSSPSVTAPQSTPLTEVASLITRGVTVDSSIEASKHAGVALKDASLHSEGRRVVMSDGCLNLVVAANDKLPSAPNENMCDDLIRSIFGRISDLAARRKSVIMDAGTSPSRATLNPELVTPAKQKVCENVPCTSVGVDLSSGTQFVDAGGCVTVKIISTDQNSEKEPSSFIKPWETVGPLPEGMAATSRPSQASNHRVLTQENVKSASSTITPGVSSDFLRVPSSVAPEGDGLTADISRLNVHSWPVSQGKEVHPSLNCHKPVGSVKNLSHLGVLLDAAVVSNIMQSAINSDSGIALVSGAVPPVVKSTRTGAAKNIAVIRPILDQTKVARSVSDSRAPINDNKGIALDVAVQVPKEIVQSHSIRGDSAIIPTAGREVPSSAPTPYNVGTNSDGNLESGPSRGVTSQNAVSYPDNAMAEGCRPLMASTSVPGNSRLSLLKPSPSQALDTGPQLSTQGKSILKQHALTNYFSHAGSSSKNPEGADAVQRENVPCPQQAEEPSKSSSEPGEKARSGGCGTTTITGITIPDSNPGEEKVLLKCIWCEEKPCELTELMCHLRGKHMDEVTKLTSGKSMQQVADAICSHPQLVPENVSSGLIGQGSVPNKATVLENAAGQVSGQGSVPNKATVLENAVGQVSGEGSVPNKATVLENAAGQVSGQGSVLNKATVLGNAAGLVSGQGSVLNKATVLENAAGLVSGQGSVLNKSMVLGNAAGQVSRQESVLNKATVLGNAAGQVSWQRSVLSKATVPGNAAGQVSRQESVLNKGTVLGNAAGQVSGQRSVLNKATVLGNAAGQVSRQESVLNKATVLGNSVGQVSGQGSVPNKAMVLGNAAGQVSGQGSVLNKATVQENAASQVTVPESVPNEARVPANVSSRPAFVQSVWIENPKFGDSCKNMILKCIWCGQLTFTFNELSLHMNEHHKSQIASLAAGICVQPSSGGSAAVSSTTEPARVGLPPVVSAPKHTERYRCKFCDYTHLSAAKLNEHLTVNHSKRLSEMMKCKPSGGNPVQPWRVTAVNPKIPSSSRTVEYVDISDGEVEMVREAIKEAVKLPPISVPGEYKCRYCPEVFTYRHLLKDHKKVFHSSRSGHKNKLRSGRERTYVDQAKQPKATPKVYHSPRGVFIDSVVKDERKSGPSSSSYSRYVDGGGSKESSTPSSSSHSRNVDGVIGSRDDNCAKPSEVPQSTPSSSSHSRNVGGVIGSGEDNCAKPSEVPQSNQSSSSHSRNVDGVIGSGEDNCAKPSEVPQGTPFTSSHSRNVDGVIGSGEDNCAKPSEVPQGTPFSSSHSRNVDGVIGSGEDNCAKPSEVPQGTPFSSLHSRNVDGVIGSRDDNCAKPSEVPQSNPSSQSRNIGGSSDAKCTKPSQSEPSTPKSISQNTVVQCPKCPSTFPNVREISRHLEEFHNVLAVSNVQNMTAADRARKQGEGDSTAKKEQVGKDLVKCSMCPILFNTPEEYRSHFAKIHMPQVYERQKQIQRDRLCKGTGVTDNSHTFL